MRPVFTFLAICQQAEGLAHESEGRRRGCVRNGPLDGCVGKEFVCQQAGGLSHESLGQRPGDRRAEGWDNF